MKPVRMALPAYSPPDGEADVHARREGCSPTDRQHRQVQLADRSRRGWQPRQIKLYNLVASGCKATKKRCRRNSDNGRSIE